MSQTRPANAALGFESYVKVQRYDKGNICCQRIFTRFLQDNILDFAL